MSHNVFILGSDERNLAQVRALPQAEGCRFHVLAEYQEVRGGEVFPAMRVLEQARRVLDDWEGSIDGVLGWFDFPVSTLLPILRREYDLPGADLASVLRCEHKYWSRLEQGRCIGEHVPAFEAFDPDDPDPRAGLTLPYPFWVKPVKSVSSYLGFEVRDDEELAEVLATMRAKIHTVAEAFDAILRFADLPPEIADLGGRTCIAEALISRGRQCTLEGYVHRGRTVVYGIVDSIREGARGSSFARYQYPSTLPEHVQRRMIDATERFLTRVGYDGSPFNAEFYWDEQHDTLKLLEVNTRISKSHAPLFDMVDGRSHHAVNLELALGREPRPPQREGRHPVAAKFFVREHEDGVVTRVPSEADLARLHERVPQARVQVHVQEGMRLSELLHQDSYSYALAVIHLGAESEEALLRAYRTCLNELGLEVRKDER
ncbi:MAG: D-alanine--D-alanine ligase [Deinococcus-Thermus bacterium]|jgi:hypothetical protein|nr:D-alanine--D-alanine ligase [Deinococcota bacterium]